MKRRTTMIVLKYFAATTLFLCPITGEAQAAAAPPAGAAPCEVKTEVPTPCTVPFGPPPPTLAVVNGQSLTLLDFPEKVRKDAANLDNQLDQTRREALQDEIKDILLESEAKRRGMSPDHLYNLEVAQRVVAPAEQQIQAETNARPNFSGKPMSKGMRDLLAGQLRDRQEDDLYSEFAARLRRKIPVRMGRDVTTPNLPANTVLATVGTEAITLRSLRERLAPRLYRLRLAAFNVQSAAAFDVIAERLYKEEAKKRNISVDDLIREEITNKVKPPSEQEVTSFYESNKEFINGDLASVRASLVTELENRQKQQLEQAFRQRLLAGATVRLSMEKPEPVVQAIDTTRSPARGPTHAPVTVVEFGDFQCPPCGHMLPVTEEALKPYNDVRFVFREFPLSMHPDANKAAEAALAAKAQGKFWEYMAILFQNQTALDIASLKKYAAEAGLESTRFDAELDSGAYADELQHDKRDGRKYGVEGTPGYFINGVRLSNSAYSVAGVRKAIVDALARSTPRLNETPRSTKRKRK